MNPHILREFLLHPENEAFVRRDSRKLYSEAEVRLYIDKLNFDHMHLTVKQRIISLLIYGLVLALISGVVIPVVILSVFDPILSEKRYFDLIFVVLVLLIFLLNIFPAMIGAFFGVYLCWRYFSNPQKGLYPLLLALGELLVGEITELNSLSELPEQTYELEIQYQFEMADSKRLTATYVCSTSQLPQIGDKVAVLHWDQELNCLL